jgi:hypothetical protein
LEKIKTDIPPVVVGSEKRSAPKVPISPFPLELNQEAK